MSATADHGWPGERTRVEAVGGAAVAGVLAVLVAAVAAAILAELLAALGLTTTSWWSLSTWLAGTGLLGGWSQTVTASVAGGIEWSTWAAGAPLAVTLAVMLAVAVAARRGSVGSPPGHLRLLVDATGAGLGAAVGAALLVVISRTGTETTNAAGTVVVEQGLTWWWTGGARPGTVVGAFLLVAGTWWINTAGRHWWSAGRPVAYGLLMLPGLALTVVASGAVVYLTSSPAVGLATLALFPLLGTCALLAAGGAPAVVGVTRIAPQPYEVWTWSSGLLVGAVGLALVLLVALAAGLVLRARRHDGGWAAGVTVPAAVAGFVCWATSSSVVVPAALGGRTEVSVNPVAAMIVAAIMAAICLAVRGGQADAEPAAAAGAPAGRGTADLPQ